MHSASINSRPACAEGHPDERLASPSPLLFPSSGTSSHSPSHPCTHPQPSATRTSCPQHTITETDVAVIGNGPAGMIMSLLLSGYEPYFHSPDASTSHPDAILHRALAASNLAGAHPRSLLDQNLPALAAHIHHQLAEAGRDANPVGAMMDSLAHPNIDTQRGEHPSYLAWIAPEDSRSKQSKRSARRQHIVLGRGDTGGIWADMDHDHTQTLSYAENMELPVYSFSDFLKEHPGKYDATLERPVRATVSAYYKEYAKKMGIGKHIWDYSTITDVFHLKDLENHCCCYLDPNQLSQERDGGGDDADQWSDCSGPSTRLSCSKCSPFRYAILGYRQWGYDTSGTIAEGVCMQQKNKQMWRQYFLLRCKTLALATGTFDQPRKLPLGILHPKPTIPNASDLSPVVQPLSSATPMFYDTRSMDDWITEIATSSPPSPGLNTPGTLPIVIVGTGLSAADAILLIRERQPYRPILHLYRYATASQPSPLKWCHKEVYPEYASIWTLMKKSATKLRRTGTTAAPVSSPTPGSYYRTCCEHSRTKPKEPCDCQKVVVEPSLGDAPKQPLPPPCLGCAYNGLADATLSAWDPSSGQVEIILSSGLRIQHRIAAIGVFIGKQVSLGFLKGSLALDYLQAPTDSTLLAIPTTAPYRNDPPKENPIPLPSRHFEHPELQPLQKHGPRNTTGDIPTPPRTPPFPPFANEEAVNQDDSVDNVDHQQQAKEDLTVLKPLVTDMWTLRLVVAPRAARGFRPLLAQRTITPRLTPTSISTPSSPTLPAAFVHNIPSAESSMSPADHSDASVPSMDSSSPEDDELRLSSAPSQTEETSVSDSSEEARTSGSAAPSAWGTMTCSIQKASRVLCQSLSYGLPSQVSTDRLDQCSALGLSSECDLRLQSDRNSRGLGGRGAIDGNVHPERTTAQLHPSVEIPSPQSCFSMPCSPVLSCVDRPTTGANSSEQRRRPWLLPLPSFLSLGRSSAVRPSSSSTPAYQPRPAGIVVMDRLRAAVSASLSNGPMRNNTSADAHNDDDTEEVIQDEQEEEESLVVAAVSAAVAAATDDTDTDVDADADADVDSVSGLSEQDESSVLGQTGEEDADHCYPEAKSTSAAALLPPLIPSSTKVAPSSSSLSLPPPPLMDQSIYAVGAVTGSKFVRFILGHCVAAVSDMVNSEVPVPTTCR